MRRGIVMHFERVGAVFELVALLVSLRRQLPRLADRNEAGTQAMRDRGAEDEAAALDSDDGVDAVVFEPRRHHLDRRLESFTMPQQRGDVIEENARLRKIRNVSDVLFQIHALSRVAL